MRKTNCCLRGLFIGFNVVFAIIGSLLTYGAIKLTAYSHQLSTVSPQMIVWFWVICIGILGISCLGIYAGYSEKILPLKIFAGFMGIGLVIMIIFGIIMAVTKSKFSTVLNSLTSDVVEQIMKDPELTENLKELQQDTYCCGVLGPEDWGTDIPDSCSCVYAGEGYVELFGTSSCRPKPSGHQGPDKVYARPCKEIVLMVFNFIFKFLMAFFFTLAVIALLSLVASLFLINQVKRADVGAPIPMKSF